MFHTDRRDSMRTLFTDTDPRAHRRRALSFAAFLLAALCVPSLRSAVEVALRQLVATFYLRYAVPSLKARA